MRVALALGGGGARGIAHIHVLAALDELGVEIVELAGSSIGGMMATARASGMKGAEIEDYALAMLGNPANVGAAMLRAGPTQGVVPLLKPRLVDLDAERVLRAFMPPLPPCIEDLAIPTTLTATDFYEQTCIVQRTGPLFDALAASIALPAIFSPVQRDEMVLIDGGISNPVPFDLLNRVDADLVVAVDVVGMPVRHPRRLPNKREQLFGASQVLMQAAIREKCSRQAPDILIRPPVNGIGVMDFLRVRRILDDTRGVKDEVKRQVEARVEVSAEA